jgi:protoheme IX farnesyltransferase
MQTAQEISSFDGPAGTIALSQGQSLPAERTLASDLYELTKPRMNFLVVITTMVGYYMAVNSRSDWAKLVFTLVGTAMTAAGSSVFNQYMERGYDALMHRTSDRPLPSGRIRPPHAMLFGLVLSICGVGLLAAFVNALTATLGAATLLLYIAVYTPAKRYTSLCTIVGAIPGAIPPMMGITAVRGVITIEALALFAILFVWQMPHFLAIAILYRDDYARGGFRMLPVVDDSMRMTGRQIVLYSIALIPVSLMPTLIGMDGIRYGISALILGAGFLAFGLRCARSRERADARKLFLASIIYLPVLLIVLMIDKI